MCVCVCACVREYFILFKFCLLRRLMCVYSILFKLLTLVIKMIDVCMCGVFIILERL